MLHEHNNNDVINVRFKSLQTYEKAINNDFDLLLLIPMKFMWIIKYKPLSENLASDVGFNYWNMPGHDKNQATTMLTWNFDSRLLFLKTTIMS